MQSVLFSIRFKGFLKYLKRGQAIVRSYGLTPSKTVQALDQFVQILQGFHCGATFPITAVAVHGYRHIDHSQLTLQEQVTQLRRAQDVFAAARIPVTGFRSPYLRFNEPLHTALSQVGLAYVSNQPILWDVLDVESLHPAARIAYERAVALYAPWPAEEQSALPHLCGRLVEIPVSLPDDEILLDRLQGDLNGLLESAWLRMLTETHQRQELFTLQLHPERVSRCASALAALLAKARSLDPPVWVARLDEIATWWRTRFQAKVTVTSNNSGELRLDLKGPEGTNMLVRTVEVVGPVSPWYNDYRRCETRTLILKTNTRPFIGVPTGTSPELVSYLQEQGYIVEASDISHNYSIYLDEPAAITGKKRALLAWIDAGNKPLVKLGRWPHNACSALAITGDIDALTLWDYGLRFLGN
jgi:hypothetical protein